MSRRRERPLVGRSREGISDMKPNLPDRKLVASIARRLALLGAAVLFLLVLIPFLATWKATPVDSIGLHYSGGPIEGTKFQGIIEPGSGRRFLGLADTLVLLPVTQRDYTASSAPGADGGPILAPARGGVEMQFDVAAYFTLNTGDETIRAFYERVCVKFGCDSERGWNEMLRVNFRGPIEQAIQQQVRSFTVDELYAGVSDASAPLDETDEEAVAILEKVEEAIAADLRANINRVLGGPYFCGPTFTRNAPDECPDFEFQITKAVPTSEAVRNAYAENSASAQRVIDAQNQARAEVEIANGQRQAQEALQGLYTDPAYIAYLQALALQECAANSNCTLVVTQGDGAGVNVNTSSGG